MCMPYDDRALTVGEIARRLTQALHRVEYVIRSRGIAPQFRAGNSRVFSEADVQAIAEVLAKIDGEEGEKARVR
jgi:hypothetical protein